MEIQLKQIGKRIASCRNDMELSQKEFADMINISHNHLSNIENGKSAPSFLLFLDICSKLNVSLDYIVLGRIYAELNTELVEKIKKCSDEDKIKISKIIDVFIP